MARSSDVVPQGQKALVRECAELLCGRRDAVMGLAEALNLNLRTVQRWAAGQNRVPPALWQELSQHVVEREEALRQLRRKLEEQMSEESVRGAAVREGFAVEE